MVVDTGDLTDWGSDQESRFYAQGIRTLGVPYVFVRGNHDPPARPTPSGAAQRDRPREPGPDGGRARDRGHVSGSPVHPDKTDGDTAEDEAPALTAGAQLAATVKAWNATHTRPVDLLLVHEPLTANALKGSGRWCSPGT